MTVTRDVIDSLVLAARLQKRLPGVRFAIVLHILARTEGARGVWPTRRIKHREILGATHTTSLAYISRHIRELVQDGLIIETKVGLTGRPAHTEYGIDIQKL